ncbi:MAG: TIGR02757 family protein [Chitinophagales bacterium]
MNITGIKLKGLLEKKTALYNRPEFIINDPISIPHRFSKLQDIEISGFWTAVFSWGQRKTIINKSIELLGFMDNAPHDFILHHSENDLKRFATFKHRTFNLTDALYFIHFFKRFYQKNVSLEQGFLCDGYKTEKNVEKMLINFHNLFFDDEHAPLRTKKHIPTPLSKSTCKRVNMFLRWMVRNNDTGVDFGLWKNIKASQLICPLDVHVDRVARSWGLIERKPTDWLTAIELTENLKAFDPYDPVKYDFALFGTGVLEKMA